MKYNDVVLWITSLVFSFVIKSTPAAGKSSNDGYQFKSQSSGGRRQLSQGMAQMDSFMQELRPFLKVRVSGTQANREVQEHIKGRLRPLGWTIEEDNFIDNTPFGEKNFTNIIATFNPLAKERIVLACHFDSKLFEKKEFIGATDSAVPCAILLELAKQFQCMLKKEPTKDSAKDITVQLVFFDGEEAFVHWTATDSIYGARHLAKKWKNMPDPNTPSKTYLETIKHFVLLDLIGAKDTKFSNIMPPTSDLYLQLSKIEGLLKKDKLLRRQEDGRSAGSYTHTLFPELKPFHAGIQDDHVPFQREDVKILHLISYPFPAVWHKASDNLSNMDMSLIDDFSRIFRVFVANYLHHNGKSGSCRKYPVDNWEARWMSGDESSALDSQGWWQQIEGNLGDMQD